MTGKRLKLTTLLLLLSLSSTALANDTPPNCNDVIQAARKAIQAQQAQIAIRDTEIDNLKLLTKKQADQIESDNAWYKNPWVLLGLGVVGGIYLGRR